MVTTTETDQCGLGFCCRTTVPKGHGNPCQREVSQGESERDVALGAGRMHVTLTAILQYRSNIPLVRVLVLVLVIASNVYLDGRRSA